MKKTAKRIICIVLCVAMMTSLFAVGASASCADKPYRYVALGDSTSMGYMLNDFDWDHNHTDREIGASSFANYSNVMKYLKDTWHVRNLEGMDLSLSGMRPMELRAMLDKDFYDRFCGAGKSNNTYDHFKEYTTSWSKNEDYDQLHDKYVNAIRNADLITFDMIMADTFTVLGGLVQDKAYYYGYNSYSELLKAEGCEFMGKTVEALRSALEKVLGDTAAQLNGLIDTLICTFAADIVHFSKAIDAVYKLNPDVNLIVVGPYNAFRGIDLEIDNIVIEFGTLYSVILEFLTSYLTMDKNAWRYRFADCSDGVEMLQNGLANGEFDEYSYFVKEIIAYALNDKQYADSYSTEEIADMKKAIQYACGFDTFSIDGLLNAANTKKGDKALVRAILCDENATDADYTKLAGVILMGMNHNAGTHPDKLGYQQKFAAIKRAFLSPVAANGAYLTRILDGTVGIVNNTVGIVFGNKTSIMKFVDFIKDLFTPLIRISL